MQRRMNVPGQSRPAAFLAAETRPSMLAGADVWVDATLTLMTTATAVPMPTNCHFMVFLHRARSASMCSEHCNTTTSSPLP